jgi:hypothetical protein
LRKICIPLQGMHAQECVFLFVLLSSDILGAFKGDAPAGESGMALLISMYESLSMFTLNAVADSTAALEMSRMRADLLVISLIWVHMIW